MGLQVTDSRKDKLPTDRREAFEALTAKYAHIFSQKVPISRPAPQESEDTSPLPNSDRVVESKESGPLSLNPAFATRADGPAFIASPVWDTEINAVVSELDQHGEIRSKRLQFWWRKTRRALADGELTRKQEADVRDIVAVFELD